MNMMRFLRSAVICFEMACLRSVPLGFLLALTRMLWFIGFLGKWVSPCALSAQFVFHLKHRNLYSPDSLSLSFFFLNWVVNS